MANGLVLGYGANLALGAFLLALGALALRIPRPGPARGFLAAYLALVGLNYAGDALRYLVVTGPVTHAFRWLAAVAQLYDPPTLLLFALFATAVRVGWAGVAAAYVPSILLEYWYPTFGALGVPFWVHQVGYAVLVLSTYLAAFLLFARRYFAAREAEDRDRWGILLVAFGVICLPRIPLFYVDVGLLPVLDRRSPESLVLEAGLLGALLAFSVLLRARARGPAWPHARNVLFATAGLLGALELEWLLRFAPYVEAGSFALLYSTRWFLFLAVVVSGLRRHELLGVPTAVAPWLRETYTALLLASAVTLAAAIVGSVPGSSMAVALTVGAAVVGVVAAAAFALRAAVPRTPSEAEWRRAAVYRAHLELGSSERELDRVRRQLGLSERERREIEHVVSLERQLPKEALPERVEPGRLLLGRYRPERVLGVGAFGRAYAAVDVVEGKRRVLKELLPDWRTDPEVLARFRREAETALRIRHPNLVEFHGIERLAEGHVLVLGEVEGETLAARLARGPLDEAAAAPLARDLLSGLAELHRHGILHRDVKPENVMLRPDGGAVLLDFGAVTVPGGGTRLAAGAHPGTPGYASPEQERGEALTPASDVYAAAALLWRALSGARPPEGRVPAAWRGPLTAALAPRPEARPADAEAFLRSLGPVLRT